MSRKQWLKFHPQDWLADAHLRMCNPASHGLLINLMALAHSGDPYGYITNGGMAIGAHEASKILSWNYQTVRKAWADLEHNARIVQAENGLWYVPRMVKDDAYSLQQSKLGKEGGNPTLKAPLKAPLKPEKRREEERRGEKNTPIVPKGTAYTSDFEEFWKAYPKKKAKGAAFKAWKRAKGRPPMLELISIVARQTRSHEWMKDGGQYIPNPATWLNGECWADGIADGKQTVMSSLDIATGGQPMMEYK